MFEKLGDGLRQGFQRVVRAVLVDRGLIDAVVKDFQRALLAADVDVGMVQQLSERIRTRSLEEKPAAGMTEREHLTKILYDELAAFFGGETRSIEIGKKRPFVILLVGLYGNGKTSSAGKLAKYFGKRGHRVCTVGLDVHRAAAPLQLRMNSEKAGVPCFIDEHEKNPSNIWRTYADQIKKYDVVIVDTAGRDALSAELIAELREVAHLTKPDEVLLVMGAEIGQAAAMQAEELHKSAGITGVVLTKLDGTAKGGGALSACAVTKARVLFVGTGEKIDDLEQFQPVRFVSRMLGMGDLQGLLERAREVVDQKKVEDAASKIMSGKFGLVELYEQMEAVKQMGPLTKVMEMIPGMGAKVPKELMGVQEEKLRKWKYIMDSMTKEELEHPDIIDARRLGRISKGAGVHAGEVRDLLRQYQQGKKLMRQMGGKNMETMMRRLGMRLS